MSRPWVTVLLVVFLAVNGLVVAGDSAAHASHDVPGLSLHAHGDLESDSPTSPMNHDDCGGGHHDCHSHAGSAPLSARTAVICLSPDGAWPPSPQPGQVLSGRQPPVPPPNMASF